MEPNRKIQILFRVIVFFSLFLNNLTNATCVPRNASHDYPIPTSSKTSSAHVSPVPPSPPPKQSPKAVQPPAPSPQIAPAPGPTIADKVKGIAQGFADIFKHTPGTNPLIINPELKSICGKTDYVDLCLASLTPFFNGKTDPGALLQTAIKAAGDATKIALAEAEKMAIAPGIDPSTASRLNDCKDSYNDALDNFQSAVEAIPSQDLGTINSMLSAVVTDFSTCDDGFIEFNQKSLLASYNEKLSQMGSNCLAIASLVKTDPIKT